MATKKTPEVVKPTMTIEKVNQVAAQKPKVDGVERYFVFTYTVNFTIGKGAEARAQFIKDQLVVSSMGFPAASEVRAHILNLYGDTIRTDSTPFVILEYFLEFKDKSDFEAFQK